MSRLDPRLADVRLLWLAGRRLQERGPAETRERWTLQIVYNDTHGQPTELGESYVMEKHGGQWRLSHEERSHGAP